MAEFEFGLFQDTQVAHLLRAQDRFLNGSWHRHRVPNWIASGVILTCSVTVKSQMFWFILSPLSIRSLLFSAMEGFSTEGLAKAGSVYTVHSGKKWRRDKNLLTHGIPTSKIHSRAYAHLFSRVHTFSSIAQIFAPAEMTLCSDSTSSHSLLRD